MPQTTSNLSNSIRTLYGSKYLEAAAAVRNYDQFSTGKDYYEVETAARLGSSITLPFLSVLPIATAVISQTVDITPRQFRDISVVITPTSRADAVDWAEAVDTQVFTDYGEARYRAIGDQMMRSVEWVAINTALQGSLVQRGAARASLDAGTAGHLLTDANIAEIQTWLQTLRCPYMIAAEGINNWLALMHPAVYYNLRVGGNIVNVGIYQDKEIILNFELGKVGPFKLLVSGDAKVFAGAGIDNASAVATTIAASLGGTANQALGTTIEVASASNISVGDWLNIGTEETGNTFDANLERVKWVSTSSTTITVVGAGPNGGLLYDHAVGEAVNNNDNVYPVLYGSPYSMVKLWDNQMESEFGTIVGPKMQGAVDQFGVLGWKWYGGYGRARENCLVRCEYASGLEA